MNKKLIDRLEALESQLGDKSHYGMGVEIVPLKKGKLDLSEIDWKKHPKGAVILPGQYN